MATIGYTSIGGSTDAAGINWQPEASIGAAERYTATTGDEVTQFAVYGDGTGNVQVGIYVYSGGVPTTRVGSAVTVAVGATAGWYTASASIALTNGVEYCVALDPYEDETWTYYYDAGGGTYSLHSAGNPVSLPGTWSEASSGTGRASVYATVSAGGGASVSPTVVTATASVPSAEPSTGQPVVTQSTSAGISASRSPAITFTRAPLENDIIYAWVQSTTTSAVTMPSGWVNVLGGTTDVESDAHQISAAYHIVTAGEAAANTVTWTLTNYYDATETGNILAAVVRGADTADPLAGVNSTFNSGNTTTPHVLASVTPDATGGLVLSGVAKDATGAYSSAPTDWAFVVTSNTSMGSALLRYTAALTTNGVTVGPTNITPSAGDEYASITIVAKAASTSSGASVNATVVTGVASVPAPTVAVGSTITATAVTATANVPTPTVSTSTDANVTATVVTAVVDVPTPTVSVGVAITATVVTATASVPAPSVSVYEGLWPTSIDGTNKRILDQNGDPLFMVGDSAWSLVGQLSTTDIDTYLEAIEAKGFNAVMFSAPEAYYTDNTPAWRNAAGDLPFSGAAFASSLNDAYWDVVDHTIDKAATLGITCIIVPQYSGYADNQDGWSVDVEAAYDASTTNLTTYGAALATRYASYPNIVWMLGHDRVPTQKFKAASKLIADELASGTSHMIIHGGWNASSTASTGDTDWNGVTGTDITTDFDTVYVYDETSGEATEAAIAVKTSIFLEGKYEQEQSQVVGDQTLREQMWEPLMAGASGAFFGNNPRWHFQSGREIYGFSGTWQNSLTNTTYNEGTVHASYLAAFLADVSGVLTTTPDTTDTFLVSGTGWARFSTSVGIAYQTAAASITLDTTELSGTGNVRIRRFDPTAGGSLTVVAASEAQNATRAISHPGTNANGDNDYVYVVDLLGDTTVSATVVTASASVPSATVTSSVAITATVVTATADAPAPTVSAGTGVSVTATVVTALSDVPTATASAGSSLTATVVTALADVPTPSVSTSGNASVTAVVVTATADVPTLSVSAGTGVTVTATVVTALAEVPTATAAASVSITAVVVTATADVPAPSVSTGGGVSISATVVTATASVPAPTLALGAGVTASVVTALCEVLAATVVAGFVAVIYGPALAADPPPILTWNPPPILAHTPPPILKGRSS